MIGRPAGLLAHISVTQVRTMQRFRFPHTETALAQHAIFACLTAVSLFAAPAMAQRTQPASKSAVQAASFDRTPSPPAQAVRFTRRPAQVGDQSEQTISFEMRLATTLRRGREIVDKNEKTIRNTQRRTVTTAEMDSSRTTGVRVKYEEAKTQVVGKPAVNPNADAAAPADSTVVQPVSGKAYRCRRELGSEGQDDIGKLIVTDDAGQVPPPAEYEIVAENMDAVGRINPLAEFLADRTIKIGEKVTLPKEVAERVFGTDQFGQVTRFDLTLQKIQKEDSGACAVFLANVEAAAHGTSQMGLQVEGPMVVQLETCRAIRTDLSGPIGMSETRGSYSTMHQLIGTGQLKMSVASVYHDADR